MAQIKRRHNPTIYLSKGCMALSLWHYLSIFSWLILEYLVSFLTERMRFLFFFPRWNKCAPVTFFSLPPIKNCFLDKILCPWLNIFLHTATFSYLLTNKIINSWFYWLNNSSSFPLIVEPMLIFVLENDQILQRSKIFTVFLILFQCFKIIPKFRLTISLLFLVSKPTLQDVNRYMFLTQNCTGQPSFFVGWVCFLLFTKTWSCFKTTFFFLNIVVFFPFVIISTLMTEVFLFS